MSHFYHAPTRAPAHHARQRKEAAINPQALRQSSRPAGPGSRSRARPAQRSAPTARLASPGLRPSTRRGDRAPLAIASDGHRQSRPDEQVRGPMGPEGSGRPAGLSAERDLEPWRQLPLRRALLRRGSPNLESLLDRILVRRGTVSNGSRAVVQSTTWLRG